VVTLPGFGIEFDLEITILSGGTFKEGDADASGDPGFEEKQSATGPLVGEE
jgi:hypothetical protein